MDGKKFHEKKRKQVLTLCKDLKANYGNEWPYYCSVLFPDSWEYLKLIKKINVKKIKYYGN